MQSLPLPLAWGTGRAYEVSSSVCTGIYPLFRVLSCLCFFFFFFTVCWSNCYTLHMFHKYCLCLRTQTERQYLSYHRDYKKHYTDYTYTTYFILRLELQPLPEGVLNNSHSFHIMTSRWRCLHCQKMWKRSLHVTGSTPSTHRYSSKNMAPFIISCAS